MTDMAVPARESADNLRQHPNLVRDLEAALAAHQTGQQQRAERLCHKVLRRQPDQPHMLYLLGVIASERGRHDYAAQLITRALARLPGVAEPHKSLGDALRALGRLDEAAENYRAAIAAEPEFAEAHCNLASVLIAQGAHEASLEHATRAAELKPALAEAHFHRGAALAHRNRFAEAEAAFRCVLVSQPDNPEALSGLGLVLTALGRIEDAMPFLLSARELLPENALVHFRLSSAQLFLDAEAAEASCRRALALDPRLVAAWCRLGEILRALGRFDEARSCLRQALALNPRHPAAYVGLALLGQSAGGEEQLDLLRALLADPNHPAGVRVDAGFALGRLLDNAERYDEAFPCFVQANALYRRLLAEAGTTYDQAAFRQQIDGLIASCTLALYASVDEEGNPSELPVFIVGMLRSGTTLVEQIAAAHSRVVGAGELPNIFPIVEQLQAHGQGRREEDLDPDLARRLADGYVARLQQIGRGAARVINKMPDDILWLGMIALLFPAARVIFCRRDPRDNALSCYFERFTVEHPWAYDLADCGQRGLDIERLAEHWRRVLPLRMLTVDYEALVADLEGESRRLIAFLGLDWEPACLDFHKVERPVLTASAWQVRQPLYARSVGRWRHYERHLGPLLEMLDGAANDQLG